jgi:hypothetical protein
MLLDDLPPFPQLLYTVHKLCLLIPTLQRAPVTDKFLTQASMASTLLCLDRTFSQIFRRSTAALAQKNIHIPLSYMTHRITLPQRVGFIYAYKVLYMSILPSESNELCFRS